MQDIYDRIADYRLASPYLDVTRVPYVTLVFRNRSLHQNQMQSLSLLPCGKQPWTKSVVGSRQMFRDY
jgi:hypothetical protein